jgi:putative ABC transport system substrate-binding protein
VTRRTFIAGLGSAAAWPLVARAQQGEQARRLGVLLGWDDNDTLAETWYSGFTQSISELGWTDGRNLRTDVRWAAGNIGRMRMYAKELVGLGPEVILASSTPVTAALQRETQTIPIVFAGISDPVGAGFVASLARPGGNITGFINIEAAIGGKWLQLLTEIEPAIKRAAIMFNPDTAPGAGTYYLTAFELLSYGADYRDIFRRSASYIDRILHGEKPAELPVQVPTKFEMAVNLKTAKALGLTVPQSILLSADEVIE